MANALALAEAEVWRRNAVNMALLRAVERRAAIVALEAEVRALEAENDALRATVAGLTQQQRDGAEAPEAQ